MILKKSQAYAQALFETDSNPETIFPAEKSFRYFYTAKKHGFFYIFYCSLRREKKAFGTGIKKTASIC